jgi:hypothetical protein
MVKFKYNLPGKRKGRHHQWKPNTPFNACSYATGHARSPDQFKYITNISCLIGNQYQLLLPSTKKNKLYHEETCSMLSPPWKIFSQFKLIWAHKGMIAMGASEPRMQKGVSLGLLQANEKQSQWSPGPPLANGASGMSS